MSALARELGSLEQELEGLLSVLDGSAAPGSAAAEAAFTRAGRSCERVRTELERDPGRADCAPALEHCLRLYAVALGMLESQREGLARERTVCSQARTRLARLTAGSPSGVSCDLSA